MGACLSCASQPPPPSPPTAKVISSNGLLRQYPLPISVSRVLHSESEADSFLCNSDCLLYDQHIPALDSDDQLHAHHIYFVLPASKLLRPLTPSDMAALAVKASLALQNASSGSTRNKGRISPLLFLDHSDSQPQPQPQPPFNPDKEAFRSSGSPAGISRSSSVKKLQRFTSRRAKMAVRSFRLRLTTIYEGTVL